MSEIQPTNSNNPTGSNQAYNEGMIKVLDDVEHVRTRPGMYIGGYNRRAACTTSSTKSSTTRSTKPWPGYAKHDRGEDQRRRLLHRHRRRPRHSRRHPPDRGHPDRRSRLRHPRRRRQVRARRRLGLQDVRRPARRRRVGRQLRLASGSKSKSPATARSTTWSSSAARRASDLKVIGKTDQDRHEGHLQARPHALPRQSSFVHETLANRLRELAYLNSGVEIVVRRRARRQDATSSSSTTAWSSTSST